LPANTYTSKNHPADAQKGETRSAEFLAKNPFHCCPTLETGGEEHTVWESNAVLRYLQTL
jgi:glutathione S-transferase